MIVSALRFAASLLLNSDKETWILIVPLIHIVSGTGTLQNRPETRHTPDWWGVALVQKEVDAHKRSHKAK